jgi:hypothetical protein
MVRKSPLWASLTSSAFVAAGAVLVLLAPPAYASETWTQWYAQFAESGRIEGLRGQRLNYLRWERYDPFDRWMRRRLPAFLAATQAEDCRRAVSLGETIWSRHPFDPRVNDLLAKCYVKLDDRTRARFHEYLSREFREALVGNGAGDSLQNPLRPISACEFLNHLEARGWEVSGFTGADSGTLYAVRYELRDKAGAARSLWVDLTPLYQGARMELHESATFEIACDPGGQLLRHARLLPHDL